MGIVRDLDIQIRDIEHQIKVLRGQMASGEEAAVQHREKVSKDDSKSKAEKQQATLYKLVQKNNSLE